MVAWSGLLRPTGQLLLRGNWIIPKNLQQNGILQTRLMSGHDRTMVITPSRWQWHKTKDILHLYFMVGAIPTALMLFLSSTFVGPAELTPIPEGYEPKHWEYHRDPISRFISRYCYNPPQMEYEKYCHHLWDEGEIIKIRKLERQVDDLMYKRSDYQSHYYKPYSGKYVRRAHKASHDLEEETQAV